MKLPRDLSGQTLAHDLGRVGYEVTRQTGSHIRLTMPGEPEHHITIPGHTALKVGTLNAIIKDVAEHLNLNKEELMRRLWGGEV
ncbi:MAG: type II toxin-antitoxin system HicA family toxin [Dehalococcoidia bacterium]|nr:type II toxin-antitoxin system HicA family toxin [Dehalococcoidia bacterium]